MVVNYTNGWPARAACLGRQDVDWDAQYLYAEHVQICGRCPVRMRCLMTAIDRKADDDIGIWGGTSPVMRSEIRRGMYEPWQLWEMQGYPYDAAREELVSG